MTLLATRLDYAHQAIDFIGADRCRTCHQDAYDVWVKSPHARALDALTAKDKNDPRCLSCHTMVPDDVSTGRFRRMPSKAPHPEGGAASVA